MVADRVSEALAGKQVGFGAKYEKLYNGLTDLEKNIKEKYKDEIKDIFNTAREFEKAGISLAQMTGSSLIDDLCFNSIPIEGVETEYSLNINNNYSVVIKEDKGDIHFHHPYVKDPEIVKVLELFKQKEASKGLSMVIDTLKDFDTNFETHHHAFENEVEKILDDKYKNEKNLEKVLETP